MKQIITLFLVLFLLFAPIKTQSQNPDIVAALQPIQALLKSIIQQDAMSFDVYEKMESYQKSLNDVYKLTEGIEGMQTYLELIMLLQEFACSIKSLDEKIAKKDYKIPFLITDKSESNCMFRFKYQAVLTSFSMSNDLIDMTLSSLQLSPADRLAVMESGYDQLTQAFDEINQLELDLIKFNL
jgi:hypothetical protein